MIIECYIESQVKENYPDYYWKILNIKSFADINFNEDLFDHDSCQVVIYPKGLVLNNVSNEKIYIELTNLIDESRDEKNNVIQWDIKSSEKDLYEFFCLIDNSLTQKRTKIIENKVKKAFEKLNQSDDSNDHTDFFEKLNAYDDEKEILNFVTSFIKKEFKFSQNHFVQTSEILKRNDEFEGEYLLPLSESMEDGFFLFKTKQFNFNAPYLLTLLELTSNKLKNVKAIKQIETEVLIWKQAIESLPMPVCLFSSVGDLIEHNNLFSKLNIPIKQCLSLRNSEIFQLTNGKQYKVYRLEIKEDDLYTLFVFDLFQSTELEQKISTDDLGIISSSIAHELNNPLAGILAAISLLELDDNWDDESRSDFSEMKKGINRCRLLISTFLGFSRLHSLTEIKVGIKVSLDQALNLIRFRLIENNIKLSIRLECKEDEQIVNASIFTMILYLVFGELITAYSHFLLVTASNKAEEIRGAIGVDKNIIFLKIENDFPFADQILGSKLVVNLCKIEKLKLETVEKKILFVKDV